MPERSFFHGQFESRSAQRISDLSRCGLSICVYLRPRDRDSLDLTSIQTAIFEFNGKLTILPVSTQRPATPSDLELSPEQELLFTELIMDGRILAGNLRRMGLDSAWLDKQLKQRGIHSAREVFLAVCDRNGKLVIYGNNDHEIPAAKRTK